MAGPSPAASAGAAGDELPRERDVAGVTGAVIVPPSWEGERNDLALAAAHPDRIAVMGRLDTEIAGARDAVRGWRRQPGMLGLRFTFHSGLKPLGRCPF